MAPGDVDSRVDATDFHVIMLQRRVRIYNGKRIPTEETRWYVFRTETPSWVGGVRVENHPENGKKWKTADGAKKALARLLAKGTIPADANAVVCHYVKTIVETRTLTPVM